ncbi:MAG: 50S ribosomal protein L9 [Epsilonproteobacteria bacterium]|nr:50S ribosomal protein L9 [Campylobacterota bacterium]NPA56522.1 50S ribosomal protein L9 [Campylobacterota bacterium]
MRVLLIKDVPNLGKAGEVKEVKDGYGRNYLIAKGLAQLATPEVIKKWEEEQKRREAEEAAEIARLQKLKEQIEAITLTIRHRAGANGALFGAITNKEVAQALKERGIEIDKKHIDIHPPIKQTGEFDIDVKLGHGIHGTLKLIVEAE